MDNIAAGTLPKGGLTPQERFEDSTSDDSLLTRVAHYWVQLMSEKDKADPKAAEATALDAAEFANALALADEEELNQLYVDLELHPELVTPEFLSQVVSITVRDQLHNMLDALQSGKNASDMDIVTLKKLIDSGIDAPGIGPHFLDRRLEASPDDLDKLTMYGLVEDVFATYLFAILGEEKVMELVRAELENFARTWGDIDWADPAKYLRTTVKKILDYWGDGLKSGEKNAGLVFFSLNAKTREAIKPRGGTAKLPGFPPKRDGTPLMQWIVMYVHSHPKLIPTVAILTLLLAAGAVAIAPGISQPPLPPQPGGETTPVPSSTPTRTRQPATRTATSSTATNSGKATETPRPTNTMTPTINVDPLIAEVSEDIVPDDIIGFGEVTPQNVNDVLHAHGGENMGAGIDIIRIFNAGGLPEATNFTGGDGVFYVSINDGQGEIPNTGTLVFPEGLLPWLEENHLSMFVTYSDGTRFRVAAFNGDEMMSQIGGLEARGGDTISYSIATNRPLSISIVRNSRGWTNLTPMAQQLIMNSIFAGAVTDIQFLEMLEDRATIIDN